MTTTRKSLWAVEPGDRPREKLERLGPAELSDPELVALVLGSGMRGINVLDSAAFLLAQAGGVQELMGMTVRELKSLMGVGVATAGRVVAVSELWRRAHNPPPGSRIEHPLDIVDAVRTHLFSRAPTPSTPTPSAAQGPGDGRAVAGDARAAGQSSVSSRSLAGDSAGSDGGQAAQWDSVWAPRPYVVVADSEFRVLVVVPLAAGAGDVPGLVARVLHEVLYRGGGAFAVVHVMPEFPADDADLHVTRDVLKLAAATVGLRYLASVALTPDDWSALD